MEYNQHFELYQGESKGLVVSLVEKKSREPINLNGTTVTWLMKKSMKQNTNIIEKSTSNGGIEIVDTGNATIRIKLEKEDTRDILGTYRHHAYIVDVLGNESMLFEGLVNVKDR